MVFIAMVITHKAPTQIVESNDSNIETIDGSHLEVLDQLDGAFDYDFDSESSTVGSESETDDEANSYCELVSAHRTKRQRKSERKRKLSVANESIVIGSSYQHSTKTRTLCKTIPKYVKMGLFGGSPHDDTEPMQQPESTTEQDTDNTQNAVDAAAAQASSADAGESQGAQKVEAVSTSDASGEYLIGNADMNAAEEFITREAKQKEQSNQTGPTPSESEAANILTSIKSGDLLRGNDGKITTITILCVQGRIILFTRYLF